jgi:hypothetical protein
MMNCNKIKHLIDQADQADVLSFEATNHVNGCASCRQFADQRASLRNLLSGIPRVNAPGNFDAQLKARMATTKPAIAWLNPSLYFRFGAATAALCVALFALQYSGIVSLTNKTMSEDEIQRAAQSSLPGNHLQNGDPNPTQPPTPAPLAPAPNPPGLVAALDPGNQTVRYTKSKVVHAAGRVADDFVGRMPRLIVRRDGKEVELPMQPISVGAQSQLLRKAARSSAPMVVMQPVSF